MNNEVARLGVFFGTQQEKLNDYQPLIQALNDVLASCNNSIAVCNQIVLAKKSLASSDELTDEAKSEISVGISVAATSCAMLYSVLESCKAQSQHPIIGAEFLNLYNALKEKAQTLESAIRDLASNQEH